MQHFLLCTDMDRTLIPNGVAPESPGARELFGKLAARPESTIAYVTGRHRALIEAAIQEHSLPTPDFAIADVGSTVYEIDAGNWQQWSAWDTEIAPDWNGMSRDEIHALLCDIPELTLQEPEKQNRHKLSYYLPLHTDRHAVLSKADMHLKPAGIRANLIWSIDEESQTGLLDILPASANKRHAVEFLMQQHGFGLDNTVFAGDSGNDLDVMLSPIPAVLVANADAETRSAAAPAASVYIAKGGFLDMNGNYSAGILEGVAHYLPDVGAWLREAR